jgi:hypothetical protein
MADECGDTDIMWFNDFDGRITHILQKMSISARNDIIDELAMDIEQDMLQDVRQKVFNICKELYENNLREIGVIDKDKETDFILQRRAKKSDSTPLARDIVDLYEFAVGATERFPRSVLARSCTYVDITKQKQSEKVDTEVSMGKRCNKNLMLAKI